MSRLLINPTAGGGRARALLGQLRGQPDIDLRQTSSESELLEETRRALDDGLDRLLVAGGDGTIHQVIQLLAGHECALGIVPVGTGNDLARALDLPLDPRAALSRLQAASTRSIDLGRIGDRVYAGVGGIGLVGEVLEFLTRGRGRFRGAWLYPYAVLRTLSGFVPPHLRIEHDTGVFEGPAMLAAVANSPVFGGGMRVAPQADLSDGLLDLIVARQLSAPRTLALLARAYRGGHMNDPAVVSVRTRRATLTSDRPLTIYGDGEPLASTGAGAIRVESWAGALRVLV